MKPEVCPNCGAEVPSGAKACPECGSDEETGWSEKAAADNLGLPDEDFNYDEFVKKEFAEEGQKTGPRMHWGWLLAAIVLLLAFLLWAV